MDVETLGDLLAALPLPVVLIGPSERVLKMNLPATSLLGAGLEGRHYITALRQPGLLDAIEAVRASRIARQVDYLAHDGAQDTTWSVTVAPAGAAMLLSFEDRTAAQEVGQMRRDFVANVSHELRTPLTALIGHIETLQGPARDDATARARFLDTMAREAQRMNRLVHDLLSLSRVEADARVRPTATVEIAGLLRQVAGLLRPIAAEAETELVLDCGTDPVRVLGDEDQLRQVFVNLAENAIKYGGGQVRIVLSTDPDMPSLRGPGTRIDVIDNGPGIDPVHLPRLTERFYRVDAHRSRAVGGTGLGLAIVKHILNRHRGRLRISSRQGPGQGSRFSVLLPMKTG